MVNAFSQMIVNTFKFTGRTSRKDFWLAILGVFILTFIYNLIVKIIFSTLGSDLTFPYDVGVIIPYIIWSLLWFIPLLSITVRRLHDINETGWYVLICLIPFLGSLILFIFLLSPADNEDNKY